MWSAMSCNGLCKNISKDVCHMVLCKIAYMCEGGCLMQTNYTMFSSLVWHIIDLLWRLWSLIFVSFRNKICIISHCLNARWWGINESIQSEIYSHCRKARWWGIKKNTQSEIYSYHPQTRQEMVIVCSSDKNREELSTVPGESRAHISMR